MKDRTGDVLSRSGAWLVVATLAGLVIIDVPDLGRGGWNFRPGPIDPHGLLGPLVRAADRRFDFGFIRTPGTLALVAVALVAAFGMQWLRRRAWVGLVLTGVVLLCLLAPAVLLQVGLRQSTAPWFFTNDSTYQIELGGELILDGENPYGHDYSHSGLERFYSLDGSVPEQTQGRQVALKHFAYFPGTPLVAAAWRVLPGPLDDFRFFVALCTLALAGAALVFPGPLAARLALGAVLAGNPLAIRAAWFGTADAPSLLALVLAFALVLRSRWAAAGALLGAAVLLKQFALVAVPFLALIAWRRGGSRALLRGGTAAEVVVLAGVLPFLIADPGALWSDTIDYGASTYRIIGYGLSALLLRAGILDDRFGYYPFVWLALAVWAPITAWLLWAQQRSPVLWRGAAYFTVSIFLLLFLGRVFQTSYLVWPLVGIVLAALMAATEEAESRFTQGSPTSLGPARPTSSPVRS